MTLTIIQKGFLFALATRNSFKKIHDPNTSLTRNMRLQLQWYLPLSPLLPLLLITDPPRFRLKIANLPQENPNCPSTKGIRLGLPAVLLVGCSEAADKRVEASPSLPERARARRRRVWDAEIRACLVVDFGFSELVEVAEEVEHVGPPTHRWGERRAVVA